MRSALRYFSVKQGLSFTSSKVADNFPLTVSTAGSCLKALEDLGVVESRTSSRKRFLPQDTDMERLLEIEQVLKDNFEIDGFTPDGV
jgi:GTP-sensing pleiotropic transcriptional regulator CodY